MDAIGCILSYICGHSIPLSPPHRYIWRYMCLCSLCTSPVTRSIAMWIFGDWWTTRMLENQFTKLICRQWTSRAKKIRHFMVCPYVPININNNVNVNTWTNYDFLFFSLFPLAIITIICHPPTSQGNRVQRCVRSGWPRSTNIFIIIKIAHTTIAPKRRITINTNKNGGRERGRERASMVDGVDAIEVSIRAMGVRMLRKVSKKCQKKAEKWRIVSTANKCDHKMFNNWNINIWRNNSNNNFCVLLLTTNTHRFDDDDVDDTDSGGNVDPAHIHFSFQHTV